VEPFLPYIVDEEKLGLAVIRLEPQPGSREPVQVNGHTLIEALRRHEAKDRWSIGEAKHALPFGPATAFFREGIEYYPANSTAAECIFTAMLDRGRPIATLYYLEGSAFGLYRTADYFFEPGDTAGPVIRIETCKDTDQFICPSRVWVEPEDVDHRDTMLDLVMRDVAPPHVASNRDHLLDSICDYQAFFRANPRWANSFALDLLRTYHSRLRT